MHVITKSLLTLTLFLSLILSPQFVNAQTNDIGVLTQIVQSLQALVKSLTKTANAVPSKAQVVSASLPSTTGGTFKRLGAQTLYEYIYAQRTATSEGWNAANTRMLPPDGQLYYNGAVIWRDKYSLGISGGHSGSMDDAHYAFNLLTNQWETLAPTTPYASTYATVNSYGEWTANPVIGRPAAQHSYSHLVTVGNDIIQAHGYAIGYQAAGSKQAHRWNNALGAWERYGSLSGSLPNILGSALYEPTRNRIVRFPGSANSGVIDTIPADLATGDATTPWTTVNITTSGGTFEKWPTADIYKAIGYHQTLDCYVMVSPHDYSPTNSVYIMNAANLSAGWTAAPVSGITPPASMYASGLEYVPPMNTFVAVDQQQADRLYYLTPTGTCTDPWVWSSETFTGSGTPAQWDSGTYAGPYTRARWSNLLNGLVILKNTQSLMEVFTPSALGKTNPVPLTNGVCGSANGVTVSAAPTTNLCSAGITGSVTTNTSTYTWNCGGINGGTTAQCAAPRMTTITPTVSLSSSPTSIASGSSATLTWSSTNSTSCIASNGWTGTKATSGTQSVTPSANTTYALSCTGTGGTVTQSTSVIVTTKQSTSTSSNWQARSSESGVIAAYDFSSAPANGGTWKWGSLSANPKVTVEAQNDSDPVVGPNRVIDTGIYPSGSTASLRWDIPSGTGERSDLWRISIDDYSKQFGANSEFWVQWRTRMNSTMASFFFKDRDPSGFYLTSYKQTLFGEGMQRPYAPEGIPRTYYGYEGPNTQTDNVLADTRSDSDHELALIHFNATDSSFAPGYGFKYPVTYHSKYFYGTDTRGQDINYLTFHNSGNEAPHVADCQFTDPGGGVGNLYTDKNTCFIYPTDQWFTLMYHVIVGPYGTAVSSLSGQSMTGYTNSTIEVWGAPEGGGMQLLHRRTGVVLRTDPGLGAEGPQKYGTFGWTTFMTHKDYTQVHPTAKIWVSQVIVKSGSVPPSTPGGTSSSTNPTPPPTVTISASPSSIPQGTTATIFWTSTNSTSCTTSNGLPGLSGSFQTSSLTNTTTYSVTCTGSGGSSTQSTTVQVAEPSVTDTTPPTVTMTTPNNNATLSGSAALISASAQDNVGVTSVQFTLGNTNLGPEDTVAPFTITWDTTTIIDGAYILTAIARDAAGNTTTATPVSITVTNTIPPDTTPPTISLTEPTNDVTLQGTAVALSAAAQDNVSIASVTFTLDGTTLTTDTSAPYGTLWNTTQSPNGMHTLTASARDLEGNTATTPVVTAIVNNVVSVTDTTPPTAPLTLTATTRSSSQIDLAWALSADDTGVTGYLVERCTGTDCATFTQVGIVTANAYRDSALRAQTTYRYRVRATDATGNRGGYSPIGAATTLGKGKKPRSSGGVVAGAAWLTPDHTTKLTVSGNTAPQPTGFLTETLSLGSKSTQVTTLQTILKNQGFLTLDSISGFYGPKTQAAVQQYQCQKGIACSGTPQTTGYGMVGLKTRTALNGGTLPTTPVYTIPTYTPPKTTIVTPQTSTALTTTLTLGMTSPQVLTLEKFLIRERYLTNVTADTTFDTDTESALRRFQCANRLVCEGTPDTTGYGGTGPRTRALIR